MKNPLTAFGRIARTSLMVGLALAPAALSAGEITLTSLDQTVRFHGEFVGFEDNTYIITISGTEMRLPADRLTCEGADCIAAGPIVIEDLNS